MTIPSTIAANIPSGIGGEVASDYPVAAVSCVVGGANNTNAVFGRAFTYADTEKETVVAGGDGVFAGIAIIPKAYAGEDGKLAVGQAAEFMFGGEVFVNLADTDADIGDAVYYVKATGCITVDNETGGVNNVLIPNGRVVRHKSAPLQDLRRLAIIRMVS